MICKSKKAALRGQVMVPGSKSHTIRAILLAAMCEGTSQVKNPLPSNDCLAAANAARAFGAQVDQQAEVWTVQGAKGGIQVPNDVIDTDNSGTTTCFVLGMAALCDGYAVITGDQQIRRRPVKALVDALNQVGANAFLTRPESEAPPVVVGGKMKGGVARYSGFSSQFISALMLAAPLADGDTEILVDKPLEKPYLQMTIDWMKKYGVELAENSGDYTRFKVKGGQRYTATNSTVPSDWSGVAFPLVAAVTTPSELVIVGVDFQDAQGDKAVVDHLIAMGADITKDVEGHRLIVKGGKPLNQDLTINLNDIPDSLPALSVAACYNQGKTTFTGLAHVRVKETDRVAVMERELTKLGAKVETTSDSMTVYGGQTLTGTLVDSHDDHRIAMALAVAGLFAEGEMSVKDAECAAVSFPNFYEAMNGVGANLKLEG